MPDMIDKNEAIKILCDGCTAECDIPCTACITVQKIIDMPTIGANPMQRSQWISVNERLPEVGQFVLVYYPKWGSDAIQVGMLESDRLHFDICGEFCFHVNKVTHWMSLPEKPEVKKNDD